LLLLLQESRGTKSYDSFELLARTVEFLPNPTLHMLLEPVLQHVLQSAHVKDVGKAQEVLRRIAIGLLHNERVDVQRLLIYVHSVATHHLKIGRLASGEEGGGAANDGRTAENTAPAVKEWLVQDPGSHIANSMRSLEYSLRQGKNEVHIAGKRTRAYNNVATGKTARSGGGKGTAQEQALQAMMLHFGFQLLHARLKRKIIAERHHGHLQMMDPFVSVLVASLRRTKAVRVLLLALQSLELTLHWPLPAWEKQFAALSSRVFDLLKPDSAASADLVQGALKLLAAMLQRCEGMTLTDAQVRLLLGRVSVEIDVGGTAQNASFALMKAVVRRRVLVPEVYDVMKIVGELLLTSSSPTVQLHCSQLYWRFLLEYPLSDKRVDQSLQYLLKNMSFEYEGGRRAVLGCLQSVVEKFPPDVLSARAQLFFLRLSLQVVQDESAFCRAAAAKVLSTLLKRVSAAVLHESMAIVGEWLQRQEVFRIGVQVAGQMVAARPDAMRRWVPALLAGAERGLVEYAADEWREAGGGAADDGHPAFDEDPDAWRGRWEAAYYALLLVEKCCGSLSSATKGALMLSSSSSSSSSADGGGGVEEEAGAAGRHAGLMPAVSEALHYPHAWVRVAAARVLGAYFSQRDAAALDRGDWLLAAGPGALLTLAKRCCVQLQSKHLDDALAAQVVKNLLFLTQALDAQSGSGGGAEPVVGDDGCDDDDDDEAEEEEEEGEEKQAAAAEVQEPLVWIFNRMSRLGTARGKTDRDVQRCGCYKWFAAVTVACPKALVLRFLTSMIAPLQRSLAYENESEDVQELAKEVMELLEQKVTAHAGKMAFANAYAAVQKQATQKRASRKRERAIEAVVDPGAAAERKRSKHRAANVRKKRQIEDYRRRRGTGAPLAKNDKSQDRKRKAD
jgi:U3 small nucleolar RNA-associated protein 20